MHIVYFVTKVLYGNVLKIALGMISVNWLLFYMMQMLNWKRTSVIMSHGQNMPKLLVV